MLKGGIKIQAMIEKCEIGSITTHIRPNLFQTFHWWLVWY